MSASPASLPLAAARGRDPGTDAPDFVEVIAGSVARRPHHPAVVGPDATLTYAELDRLSNQLAQRFVAAGVGRDGSVGISLPRGAGELVAMLATIKAGGAYVPLDPSHPVDRLQIVLEDAAPQVMVIHPGSPLAGSTSARNVIVLDDLAQRDRGLRCDAAGRRSRSRAARLRPVHLGLDRTAQGGRGSARGLRQLPALDGPRARAVGDRPAAGGVDDLVRHRGARAVPAALCGRDHRHRRVARPSWIRACSASGWRRTTSPSCRRPRRPGGCCWRRDGRATRSCGCCAGARP